MFNARQIISDNNSTFYDYDSQKKKSQTARLIVWILLALGLSLVFAEVSDNFLAGFLAVQSILLGFTVNVMFFLLGRRPVSGSASSSREAKERNKRLARLYKELFYNVSYFNLLAIYSIIVTAINLMPSPEFPVFSENVPYIRAFSDWAMKSEAMGGLAAFLRHFGMFVFYLLAIEVVYSIARVIGRTSFYFERTLVETRGAETSDSK